MKDVMGKLTKLRYLNLSMFLNPIFYYHSEDENHEYIQSCISSLGSLEHLDLSHNTFLSYLPGSPGKLSNLHTLDLSGCIRLKKIYGWMGEIESLKLSKCGGVESCVFAVHSNDSSSSSSSLVQLEHVNCQELEIRCLEKVKSMDEARMIMMAKKWKVERLKLCWTMGSQGQGSVDGNVLLEGLQPPESLKCLELHGYNGKTCFSSWWRKSACHLLHLVEVTMEDFPRCSIIPPLGLLPNLQKLILRRMASLRRIDLSDSNRKTFSRPTEFTIDDMEKLEELIMLPAADELVIRKCPKLCFGPLLPRARKLLIFGCNQVMASWHNKGTVHPTTSEPVVTQLVVESCHLPLSEWSLLHHLPGLHILTIKNCPHLTTFSQEIVRALSSLQTLCFSHCDEVPHDLGELSSLRELQLSDCAQLRQLPESLGDLKSLKKLAIERCPAISYMPEKLIILKDLHILDCPILEQWCEFERSIHDYYFEIKKRFLSQRDLNEW
uniref:Uncharacterized protein n=1 Tax=Avena sativa TaxID=4498 RepID=A0ACD5YUH6_AVESA